MRQEVDHYGRFLDTRGDAAVAVLAARQGGVVSRAQLVGAGVTPGAIRLRVRNGRLHPLHRGVYMVGHTRIGFFGRLWAAVLACGGPGAAVISHRSAAAVHDLLPVPSGPVEVITLRQSRSSVGVRVHRSRTFDPDADMTERGGLPVTTPMRTISDLAATLSAYRLERLCHRAEHLRLLDQPTPTRRRGARALRRALSTLTANEPDLTRSELEERFLSLVAQHHLPLPQTNVRIAGHDADFAWSEHRLIVETDGQQTHLTPTAFERDRARDAQLTLAGYRVVRFTWRQVVDRPREVARALAALLRSPS